MSETQPRSVGRCQSGALILVFGIVSMPVQATEFFNASLSFETRDQSMWATGDAFIFDYRQEFLSPAFSTGSIFINPGAVSGGGITVDPRFAFSATGQMGVAAGFYLNSGSINANLDYGVSIGAASPVRTGDFFRFQGSAVLDSSSMLISRSPTIETYLDGILRISVNDYYEAKVSGGTIFNGVTNGTFTSQRDPSHGGPRVDVDEQIEMFGFNSGGRGRLVWKGADLGGVGDVIEVGNPLAPVAEFTIGDWRIDAAGGVDDSVLSAEGQTTLLTTLIDVDAAVVGPALGPSIDVGLGPNLQLSAGYDIVDFDVTLATGYRQQFMLVPSVAVTLNFSDSVLVRDVHGQVTETDTVSASSLDALPEIALIGSSVDVTPVFTISADLYNQTDILLDLLLQYKALDGHLDLDFSSPFYSNDDLYSAGFGPMVSWESDIAPLDLEVYNQAFAIGGFNSIAGATFTLAAVPAPPALWLFGAGLAAAARWSRVRKNARDRAGNECH